ncbi:MAG: hypothetical protein IT170_00050 [Bryobacterales bacterium]|nr:hypothetical protein [Bryobacterales bacterium]
MFRELSKRMAMLGVTLTLGLLCIPWSSGASLPGAYFERMAKSVKFAQEMLDKNGPNLRAIEAGGGGTHFPYSILSPAVLYTRQHRDNPDYRNPKMLAQALAIGDMLAAASEERFFETRLDSDWDTYMWMEAYRLLKGELGAEREARWRREILHNVDIVEDWARPRRDFPWYATPYIGTSANHYALYAMNLFLAGKVFEKPEMEALGEHIYRRFVTVEQAPDGYWGEHSRNGPTLGYNHLTTAAVALYSEHSDDPDAIRALRKATDLHKWFTYFDGTSVHVVDDRNRYGHEGSAGAFGFSRFPDGRRLAEMQADTLTMDPRPSNLGWVAQNALYYHEGDLAAIPQDEERGYHQLQISAGMRKAGPWMIALSGIIDTPTPLNRFYLDRQGNVEIFHKELGLIINGANSKRQLELATFVEKVSGLVQHTPTSSRLQMTPQGDRLSVAYQRFFADLEIPEPTANEVKLTFNITGKYEPPEESNLTLQLCLHPGEELVTGAGRRFVIGKDPLDLDAAALGGEVRHHGWKLALDPGTRITWPVYPYNPYQDARETTLDHAVAAVTVPLKFKGRSGIRPNEQQIVFTLTSTKGQ